MGKIFVGQTKLILKVTANHDVTGATATIIKAKKPSGTTVDLTATVEDALTGILVFSDFQATTLDEAGDWKFWAYVTFADGKVAAGEPVVQTVYNVGC